MSSTVQSYQLLEFYIHGSVHRNSMLMKSNEMQQYADIYLLPHYSTCFGCPWHPPSGVRKTVISASGLVWDNRHTDCPKPVLIWSRLKKLASQIV